MAQEVAIREKKEQGRADADVARSLADFLHRYKPDEENREKDVLDNSYQISMNSPLPEFDCKTAKAYAAIDIRKPSKKQYVAHVCEVGSLPRVELVAPLVNSPHPNLMAVVSAGVVELSRPQEERFVIVYERPAGKRLSDVIAATKKRPSFEFVCNKIIAPLALAIKHLSELGIAHGNINCDNIYFYNEAVLGHCLSESCGLSQPFYCEPLERMQAIPSGKGGASTADDYYALAVSVLPLIYGANHFSGLTEESLIRSIMKDGSFNALTRNKDLPEVFYDFFRGLLNQNHRDRWGHKYLKAWLDGKRYNVMPSPPPQEAIRPFEFAGGSANTRREVAHLFARNWAAVPDAVFGGELTNWVAISLRNKELNDFLAVVAKNMAASQRNDIVIDEQIMRLIAAFDHTGPVRLRRLSFVLDGINSLFADLMLNKEMADVQLLMRFIELSMFNFISDQKLKDKEKRDDSDLLTGFEEIIGKLERVRATIRNTGLGFGAERVLYDLNPNIQCLSPLLAGKYVSNIGEMLKVLDQVAVQMPRDKDPIDEHVAAFIASKLNVTREIRLEELSTHNALANSRILFALKILAAAHRRSRVNKLMGLTHCIAIRILPLLEEIRSKTLKKKMIALLEKAAASGDLQKMEEIFIESGYNVVEDDAFRQAVYRYRRNESDIAYYKNSAVIEAHSKRLGNSTAYYIAIAALALSFYLAVKG